MSLMSQASPVYGRLVMRMDASRVVKTEERDPLRWWHLNRAARLQSRITEPRSCSPSQSATTG